jgi:hypothetical protein
MRCTAAILLHLACAIAHFQPAHAQDARSTGLNFLDESQYRSIPLASTPLLGNIPDEVDLSSKFPRPGNQGRQSSCVGWAVSYLKTYHEFVERGWSNTVQEHQFSPSFIYNQIKSSPNSCEGGSNFVDALNILRRDGIASLRDFPYDETACSATPSASVKQRSREFSIADWRRVNVQDEVEIKTQLASGFPVLIGMMVDDLFSRLTGNQIYSRPGGVGRGGHAMVVVGYSESRSAFKVINSWGTDWGANGFGWVSFAAFRQTVREAFVAQDIVITTPLPGPVRPNVPPPVPAPDRPVPVPPPQVVSVQLGTPMLVHNLTVQTPTGMFPGMQIRVPGLITGARGRILQLVVKFNYFNGPPLRANPIEMSYRDAGGLVATGTQAISIGGDSEPTDPLQIFIPYYALNFQPTGGNMTMNLSFTVIALVDNTQQAQTPPIAFPFRW